MYNSDSQLRGKIKMILLTHRVSVFVLRDTHTHTHSHLLTCHQSQRELAQLTLVNRS